MKIVMKYCEHIYQECVLYYDIPIDKIHPHLFQTFSKKDNYFKISLPRLSVSSGDIKVLEYIDSCRLKKRNLF